MVTGCLLTAIDRSALYSTTICSTATCDGLVDLERKVDVDTLLAEGKRRHEDDEEHEQHVDERRDVHLRAGVRGFPRDDPLRAEMLVRVFHGYLPPTGGVCGAFGHLRVGDEADVLDPGFPQVVHRRHDRPVRGVGVTLDEHDRSVFSSRAALTRSAISARGT